eukprot:1450854-Amphidinium_carterae.1
MVDQFKMSQLKSDACVFKNTSDSMFMPSYVDDLLIIGEEPEVNAFITALEKVFNLKHTTHLTSGTRIHFLGRKIHRRLDSVIKISMMESFMKSVYDVYGLQRSNSVSAPGVKTPALQESGDGLLHFTDHKQFRVAVGQLQWMAAVRPDIQFAVRELSRKLSAPTTRDESAAKHLIGYLRGTQNLVFSIAPSAWRSNQCIELHAYCDSDWAGCPVSR